MGCPCISSKVLVPLKLISGTYEAAKIQNFFVCFFWINKLFVTSYVEASTKSKDFSWPFVTLFWATWRINHWNTEMYKSQCHKASQSRKKKWDRISCGSLSCFLAEQFYWWLPWLALGKSLIFLDIDIDFKTCAFNNPWLLFLIYGIKD